MKKEKKKTLQVLNTRTLEKFKMLFYGQKTMETKDLSTSMDRHLPLTLPGNRFIQLKSSHSKLTTKFNFF